MTAGVEMSHAAMSLDGSRLVYAKGGPVANVWRVPFLEDRRATWAAMPSRSRSTKLIPNISTSHATVSGWSSTRIDVGTWISGCYR